MNKKEAFKQKYSDLNEKEQTLMMWSAFPFFELLDEIEELYRYLDILSISFPIIQNEDAIRILKGSLYSNSDLHEKIDKIHLYLKAEKEGGYFHTNSQFSILLFAYLEGGIKRFIMSLFEHYPSIYEIKEVKDIKISIAEYKKSSDEEIYGYLFEKYEDAVAKGERYGVSRFEKMLKPLGFGGVVDEEIRKAIFELAQIRNCILHKGGKADKTIIENCPWLNFKLNERINIENKRIVYYCSNVMNYVMVIFRRVKDVAGNQKID